MESSWIGAKRLLIPHCVSVSTTLLNRGGSTRVASASAFSTGDTIPFDVSVLLFALSEVSLSLLVPSLNLIFCELGNICLFRKK